MDASEDKVFELALIENIQRENLNVVEEAKAYKKIIITNGLKADDLSRSWEKAQATSPTL